MSKLKNFLIVLNQAINSLGRELRLVFFFLSLILVVSAIVILAKINAQFMVTTPKEGGAISEGIIESPRFINPLLAFSNTDNDMASLVYSGLLRKTSDRNFINDLAEKYEISSDGLKYKVTLKNKLFFHDGSPITADDVIFTVKLAQDPILKSPQKIRWEGVAAEKIDDLAVEFILRQPYAFFLENLTLGILPKSKWQGVPVNQIAFSTLNLEAVGAGPYKIKKISRGGDGIVENITLTSWKRFSLGKPFIQKIIVHFYPNEEKLLQALRAGYISQAGAISPANALVLKKEGYDIAPSVLPRLYGLFPNQNQASIFTDKIVLEAFNLAINKKRIVEEILQNYGEVIDSPVPKNIIEGQESSFSPEEAASKLLKAGWQLNAETGVREKKVKNKKDKIKLEFAIYTAETADLKKSAELVKEDLEAIGAKIEIKVFEIGDLNQNIIRPRKYDMLLFGQVINNIGDLFSFWHSSQRTDPGLNIALYTSTRADKILEEILKTIDEKERLKKLTDFQEEIQKDKPAIFLYSPDFIYIVDKDIKNLKLPETGNSFDRFAEIYRAYIEKENIWRIFAKNKEIL